MGRALGNVVLKSPLTLDSVEPASISPSGGVRVTLSGSGMNLDRTTATLCGEKLQLVEQINANSLVFLTPELKDCKSADYKGLLLVFTMSGHFYVG